MDYGLSYREKHNLSESDLTDAQRTLNCIAENMRMQKSISVDGYKHFQDAIEALGGSDQDKWIPLKARPMTEEEANYYRAYAEYGVEMFDCPLPDDGQEVLISRDGKVGTGTFVQDDLICYFGEVGIDNVDAWQPMPKPYEEDTITKAHNPAPVKETTIKDRLNDTLNEIKAELEKLKEGDYACFNDDEMQIYTIGLNAAIDVVDKYNAKPKDIEAQKKDGEWVNFAEDLLPIIKDDDDLER